MISQTIWELTTTLKPKVLLFLLALLRTGILSEVAVPFTRGQTLEENRAARSLEINRAEALLLEALNLSETKERELARTRLEEAMRLWMRLSDSNRAARAALQVGDRYRQGRRYQESIYCYERALRVEPIDGKTRADAFNSLARVYSELYERDLALRYYGQARKLALLVKDNSSRVVALTGMAELYCRAGDNVRALACIAEGRELHLSPESSDVEVALMYLQARIDLERGQVERALQGFENALAIYQRTGDSDGQVKVLCSLSSFYLVTGKIQLSAAVADRAVQLAETAASRAVNNTGALQAREMRWRAWLSHARAHRAAKEKDVAIKSFRFSIAQLEALYWSVYIATENSAIAFREELQAPYRELVDLLMEQGEFLLACEAAERARARAMLGMAEARRMMASRSKVDEEGSLRTLSETIAQLRSQLESLQDKSKERIRLQRKMQDTRAAMDEARYKLEMKRSRDRVVWFQPATASQLQARMAQTNAVMLQFLIGENRSFVWLISSNDISFRILPGRKEIETLFTEFTELLANPPNLLQIERELSKVNQQGERLFSSLLGQLYDQIPPGKKLIIVPDRFLHYLPFEALVHNGRYLIEDHEISYVPSGSMLGLWQDSKGNAGTEGSMELLAIGDPSINRKPKSSGKKRGDARRYSEVKKAQVSRASRGFNLTPLPRARDEVQYIARLFPVERRRVYIGSGATEAAFKKESLYKFRRVHFATHSLIDEAFPSRSAVVLSLSSDPQEDGFLEVNEISELDLDCDVVVLSACQTGRGRLFSGEGIVGLSRAFLYAGAKAIVVSLWDVSDMSTGQLMKDFYQYLTAGLVNTAALRKTKLNALKGNGLARHPSYWASFVLIGKP